MRIARQPETAPSPFTVPPPPALPPDAPADSKKPPVKATISFKKSTKAAQEQKQTVRLVWGTKRGGGAYPAGGLFVSPASQRVFLIV